MKKRSKIKSASGGSNAFYESGFDLGLIYLSQVPSMIHHSVDKFELCLAPAYVPVLNEWNVVVWFQIRRYLNGQDITGIQNGAFADLTNLEEL